MSYFEATNLDWELFEDKFNILRSNVVEVKNIFRHMCRLYVIADHLQLWNDIQSNPENKTEITYYELTNGNKWYKKIRKNEILDKSLLNNKINYLQTIM